MSNTISVPRKNTIQDIINSSENTILTEVESKKILSLLDLLVPSIEIAKNEEEAIKISKNIGFPVVLKIVSPEITHKSDAGCVKVNLKDEYEVSEAFLQIMLNAKNYNPNAQLQGVSVQPNVEKGTEIIVGMNRDEVFGPVLLFGLGGIFVEVVKDVSLRVLPLDSYEIEKMIKEIKGYPLLAGYRGEKVKDIEAIKEIIEKIAFLSEEFPEIKEIDLNPVFVYDEGKGASVVDARIILD